MFARGSRRQPQERRRDFAPEWFRYALRATQPAETPNCIRAPGGTRRPTGTAVTSQSTARAPHRYARCAGTGAAGTPAVRGATHRHKRNAAHSGGVPLVHLLQVYSNPSRSATSPQELLFRSTANEHQDARPEPRRRARQLRTHEAEAVIDRYREVRNIRTVAAELRLSRSTVARILNEHGVDATRRMTAAQISEAAKLYEQGLSSGVIGKQLGYDNHTILRALRRRGVPIRPAAHRK